MHWRGDNDFERKDKTRYVQGIIILPTVLRWYWKISPLIFSQKSFSAVRIGSLGPFRSDARGGTDTLAMGMSGSWCGSGVQVPPEHKLRPVARPSYVGHTLGSAPRPWTQVPELERQYRVNQAQNRA